MIKNDKVNEFIETSSEEQREILGFLRDLIMTAVPDSTEQFKWSRPVYAKAKDFCYLKKSKKFVSLGFFNFDKIDDPDNLLMGTGKQMRHINIAKMDDIKKEIFIKMLEQAAS